MFGSPTAGKLDDVGLNARNSNARNCAGYFLLPWPITLIRRFVLVMRLRSSSTYTALVFPWFLTVPLFPLSSCAVLAIASLCAHLQFHTADSVLDDSTSAEPA